MIIITQNRGNDLEGALSSVPFPAKTLIGSSLNKLLEQTSGWVFYLRDNEKIIHCNENMDNLDKNEVYAVQILQGEIIVKEPRIWCKKAFFKNPIYERINLEPTKVLDIIISQTKIEENSKILDEWRRNQPLSADAAYYKAFDFLSKKQFPEFENCITQYFFYAKNDIASTMARYYLAVVQSINKIDLALQNIILCLSENPLMAEFWCLLGDIFLKLGKNKDAIIFYENAIILGSRRLQLDFWPIHISKYSTYPQEMLTLLQS